MGQIVKGKKKGRPSKADLARRAAAVDPPTEAPPPPEGDLLRRRSIRPRNFRHDSDFVDYVDDDDDDDDLQERVREKKLNLVLMAQNGEYGGAESPRSRTRRVDHAPSTSSDYENGDRPMKKRKTDEIELDLVDEYDDEVRGRKEDLIGVDYIPGPVLDSSGGFPLPDKQSLELILDKIQKKDKYNVYAEPVDPEELPDYYDVIEHPMDFATVRKKLANGLYSTLEEFENDVFLICTNAMQYNPPSTMYYRQARSIQELARNKFQRIRADIESSNKELKSQQNTRFGSMAEEQIKKPTSVTAQEPLGSDFFSGATFATAGDFPDDPNPIRAGGYERPSDVDGISSLINNNLDKAEDLLSGKKVLSSKFGRKPSVHEENRRATYNISDNPSVGSESTLTTFNGEIKQLVAVGLHSDHSYSRSLARFSATLSPLAWKVASRRITQALPPEIKFGRGWVGDYEPLPKPLLTLEKYTQKDHIALTKSYSTPAQERVITGVNLGENPSFLSSANANCQQQNPKTGDPEPEKRVLEQVELTTPPSANQNRAGFVAENQISNGSEMPAWRSTETILRTGVLLQSEPFKQPKSNGVLLPNGKCTSLDRNIVVDSVSSHPVESMRVLVENGKRHERSLGTGEFNPAIENTRKYKHPISANMLHNPTREPQPQVSGVAQFQYEKNGSPLRMGNEAQFRNTPMVYPRLVSADSSRFQVESHWQSINPQKQQRQRQESLPPDLNMVFQSSGSPIRRSSSAVVDSQQPDLALQL